MDEAIFSLKAYQKRHAQNMELLQNYLQGRADLKPMIDALLSAIDDVSTTKKGTTISIAIGQRTADDTFYNYLSSYIYKPRIIVDSYKNEPQIVIGDKIEARALFNLTVTHIISYQAIEHKSSITYNIVFVHNFKEYKMKLYVPKNE